jgi:hypothetical protein
MSVLFLTIFQVLAFTSRKNCPFTEALQRVEQNTVRLTGAYKARLF